MRWPPPCRGRSSCPEDLPDDCGILQEILLRRREAVEARAMMPWRVSGSGSASLEPVRRRARRTAPRRAGFRRRARGASSATRPRAAACPAGGRGRRSARRRAGRARASSRSAYRRPRPAPLGLRPRGRDGSGTSVTQSTSLVEEVEKALVRPVDVLDDQDERALLGEPSRNRRQAANASLRRQAAPPRRVRGAQADAPRRASSQSPARCPRPPEGSCARSPRWVQDAGLRLHDITERPHRDAVPVREAATLTPRDDLRVGVDDPEAS